MGQYSDFIGTSSASISTDTTNIGRIKKILSLHHDEDLIEIRILFTDSDEKTSSISIKYINKEGVEKCKEIGNVNAFDILDDLTVVLHPNEYKVDIAE